VIERGKAARWASATAFLARTEDAGPGLVAHPMKKLPHGRGAASGRGGSTGGQDRFWLPRSTSASAMRRRSPIWAGEGRGDLVLCEAGGRPPRAARVAMVLGDPLRAARLQPDRDPQIRHPSVFSETTEGGEAVSASCRCTRTSAKTCAICRSSRSTR
jgi:ribonuclease R